jgi:hypothetical protein
MHSTKIKFRFLISVWKVKFRKRKVSRVSWASSAANLGMSVSSICHCRSQVPNDVTSRGIYSRFVYNTSPYKLDVRITIIHHLWPTDDALCSYFRFSFREGYVNVTCKSVTDPSLWYMQFLGTCLLVSRKPRIRNLTQTNTGCHDWGFRGLLQTT